jgi:hypothetical protein
MFCNDFTRLRQFPRGGAGKQSRIKARNLKKAAAWSMAITPASEYNANLPTGKPTVSPARQKGASHGAFVID